MPYTNFEDSGINKLYFGNTAFAVPATHYIALSTTTPAADGTGFTEPASNYARVTFTNNSTNWHPTGSQPGTGQRQSNAVAINFTQASGSWGVVTYVGIWDAASSGNLLAFQVLNASQTINIGDTLSFAIDALTVTLA